jgi:hypothetical protein
MTHPLMLRELGHAAGVIHWNNWIIALVTGELQNSPQYFIEYWLESGNCQLRLCTE